MKRLRENELNISKITGDRLTDTYIMVYHNKRGWMMRRKNRGTLQINDDVKRLFVLAKPLNSTSSEFLKGLLLLHARDVREAQQRTMRYAGLAALNALGKTEDDEQTANKETCLGRPAGAKDLRPRKRRTKAALAKAARLKAKQQD